MAYQIDWTSSVRAIPEQRWGSAQQVEFTYLDSCIGVVAKTIARKVIGIHLVLIDGQGNLFDDTGIRRVREIVDGGLLGGVFIIGDYATWADNLGPVYTSLRNGLGHNVREYQARGRGIGGRLNGGTRLQYCINGRWANV
ncbi:MAG: hypothetical protein K0V04_14390 [Deltaproteobacteria bacterium]|nr:hypothetical protein [Deltaproteobacteria bacterium]